MRKSRGFTIAELAVAVAILAVLLFGAMVPFSAQVEIRNVTETRRTLDSIREAIIGYAQSKGRLPCPANGSTVSGAAGAGTEQYSGAACSATFGAVPWATLGTPETDNWGRRFSYWVSPIYADVPAVGGTYSSAGQTPACNPNPEPGLAASFALCSLGVLTVSNRSESTRGTTFVGQFLPVVVISHGKNGYGAYTPAGITLSLTPGVPANADEVTNANHTTGTSFISRNPTGPTSGCNDTSVSQPLCEFDDIVMMIPASVLNARMVAAGKLP
jgi:prepilin-type N-terminal cleavage/methylation domain-containing protein